MKANVTHSRLVRCGRHALQRLQRLLIALHRMFRTHQTLPCCRVRHIGGKHLPIEAGRLIHVVCLLQQCRELQLRLNLQPACIGREREIERAAKDALRIRITPDGGVR